MSENTTETPQISMLPVLIVMGLIIVFSVIFLIEFAGLSGTGGAGIPEDELTAASYMDIVEPLLINADPARAPAIMQRSELICMSCHMDGSNVAPMFSNVADVADERRPPLLPAAYIYESIVHPGAFVAEGAWGDSNNMPRYYRDSLTDEELGDLIAWLLLTPAERDALDAPTDVVEAVPDAEMTETVDIELSADTYMDMVGPLLVETDPARGPELLSEYACSACHEPPNAGVIGPGHDDLAEAAAQRRAPLTAEAYIYESIIYPDRHIVDGYQAGVMPKNYATSISDEDLGDLIAYLLLSEAQKSALE